MRVSNKKLSIVSILLFLIPFFTIIICLENHSNFKNEDIFPFYDGKVSISLVGRQFYNVILFKLSFLIYGLLSILFYSFLFTHFNKFKLENNMNIMGLFLNIFLFIYLIFLGDKSLDLSNLIRRIAIILYIILLFIIHIRSFFYLKILTNKKKGFFFNLKSKIFVYFF